MAPEDVSHLLNTPEDGIEQQAAETTNTDPAAPETPEVPQYIRLGEREYSPDDLSTKIRIADDYEKNFADLRKRERAAWEREQRAAQIEEQWQRHQAEQAQPRQPQTSPADDDPIAMLRALNNEVRSIRAQQEEERQFFKQQLQEQWLAEQAEKVDGAYRGLNSWVDTEAQRTGRKLPKFSIEELEQEIVESGMAQNKRLSWENAMRKAYQNLAWDSAMNAAEQAPIDRLRQPKATVTVPSGRGGGAPAPAPPADNGIGNMTLGDVREFFPNSR
jgi:hypothetical protein